MSTDVVRPGHHKVVLSVGRRKVVLPLSPIQGLFRPARAGRFELRQEVIPAGSKVAVVSMRSAFMTGESPFGVTITEDLTITSLGVVDSSGAGTMMTDRPQELYQLREFVARARGKVFTCGLGLGVAARLAAQKNTVGRVTVVEVEPDVVALCGRDLPKKISVVLGDVCAYIEEQRAWTHDASFFDFWYGTNESEWVNTVAPVRRRLAQKFGRRLGIYCWAEPEMLGQVRTALAMRAVQWVEHEPFVGYRAFREALPASEFPARSAEKMTQEERDDAMRRGFILRAPGTSRAFDALFSLFTLGLGTPEWERTFGKAWPLVMPGSRN